jgi:DNA-binding winged helix-turn-helix (wHTH) protein
MTPARLAFADCVLDVEAGTLERAGRRVAAGPRVVELLAVLASNAGRALTREELRRAVWRDEEVSDWALSRAVFEARRAIGDGRPHRIETLRGRGFRFRGDVHAPAETAPALAGRRSECGELDGALAAALAGERSLVLVSGEPGSGKTRLLDEARRMARERGFRVIVSRCGADSDDELAPWLDVWRGLAESGSAPEMPALLAALPAAVERAARQAPLLLLLDDLHRLTEPALPTLPRVAQAGPRLAVIAAFRDSSAAFDAPGSRAIEALARMPGARRVALDGLDAAALDVLARSLTGRDAPPALLERSGGNPYLARALLGGAAEPGELPAGVRTGVAEHVAELGSAARALLAGAAVLGTSFELTLAARVAGVPREPAAEELLRARLCERAGATLRFRHGVVTEAAYDALPRERRRELHARAARELLEAGWEQGVSAPLRRHVAAAAGRLDAEGTVAGLRASAVRAVAAGAYGDAADLLETALPLATSRDERALLELLIELGAAEVRAMRLAAGRATLSRAAQLARALGDARSLARTAIAHAGYEEPPHVDEERVAPLEEALAALPAADDPVRARVLGALARALAFDSDAARREALAREAAAMAGRLADPETRVFALRDLHFGCWAELGPDERRRIAREGIACAAASGDALLEHEALMEWIADLLEAGDRDGLDAALAAHRGVRERSRHPIPAWHGAHYEAMRALLDGDLAAAERALDGAGRLGREAGYPLALQWQALQLYGLRREQGRLGELRPVLREVARSDPATPWPIAAALLDARAGDLEPAWTSLRARVRDGRVEVRRDFSELAALALLAELCEALGAAEEAAVVGRALAAHAGLHVTVYGMLHLGSVEHYLGLAAEAAGDRAGAAERYVRAEASEARLGARAARTRTRRRLSALGAELPYEETMTTA